MNRKRDRWDSSSEEDDDDEYDSKVITKSAPCFSSIVNGTHDGKNEVGGFGLTNGKSKTNINGKMQGKAGRESITGLAKNSHILSSSMTSSTGATTTNIPDNSLNITTIRHYNPLLQGCRKVYDTYERIQKIDEGTYGIVWKAREIASNEIVALKQIKFDSSLTKEGFPIAALREISVLLALSHECIVTVQEMVVGSDFDKVFMVMEYMQCDLKTALEKLSAPGPFPQAELKNMLYQIISATAHIHDRWIIHRDLKTSNILVHHSGKICLCDFGLARKYQLPLKAMTQTVITLWYRPIELLFGQSIYGPEVDMWSIGCIFGEILKKEAILQGQGELDQIDLIFKLLGVPNESTWPEFKSLPNANLLRWKQKDKPTFEAKFPINSFSGGQTYLDNNGFDLLKGLLTVNPKRRLNANQALNHDYFKFGVKRQTPRFNF